MSGTMRRLFFYDSYVAFRILKSKPRFRVEELIKNESWLVEDVVLTDIFSAASINLNNFRFTSGKISDEKLILQDAPGDRWRRFGFQNPKDGATVKEAITWGTDKWTQKEK